MCAANPGKFAKDHGIMGYLHHLAFPMDLFATNDEYFECARNQRFNELTPVIIWLIPAIIMFSGLIDMNIIGIIILYLIEIAIMTFISVIYCWRASFGFIIETAINYTLSFIIFSTLFFVIVSLLGACGIIFLIIGIIFIAQKFNNNGQMFSAGSYSYDNDDDEW